MYKVVKCFEFEAAHQLINTHTDKCKRIHGHTYKLEVELSSQELNENGMVLDFTLMSQQIEELVDDFDHVLIVKGNEDQILMMGEEFLYDTDKRQNHTIIYLKEQPTAEYMCRLFFDYLSAFNHFPITRVRLWETSNSYAEYIKD